jgi:3-carboxy-cis,cis-muconate cycloisomerase
MRPSSSSSPEPAGAQGPGAGPGLFDEVLAAGPVRDAVADRRWLAAMLEAEAALARAQAALGLIPAEAAAAITAACVPERYDLADIAAGAAGSGTPVLPLVTALRRAVPGEVRRYVHAGATSQDILDTAAMLVAHRALGPLLADLDGAAEAAGDLARRYRDTPAAGRTLLQHAVPVTFGLKAAGWLVALREARDLLVRVRTRRLAVQLGGAAGTLDAYGDAGPAVVRRFAAELGLAAPLVPWHTDRTRVAELAGALATAAGVAGKAARDVTLLAQSEVGEVAEAAPGASSAMPHKRNPVAAVATLAAAAQAPGLAATVFGAMVQEHERAAGAWHAEWRPLRELLVAAGSAVHWLRRCLSGLVVDEAAVARNLARLRAVAGETAGGGTGAAAALVDLALAAGDETGERP